MGLRDICGDELQGEVNPIEMKFQGTFGQYFFEGPVGTSYLTKELWVVWNMKMQEHNQFKAKDYVREQRGGDSQCSFVCGCIGLNPTRECIDADHRYLKHFTVGI